MQINLKGNLLVLTFSYNEKAVDAVRTLTGRHWNKNFKHWEVPKENVLEVLEVMEPLGFRVHLDVRQIEQSAKNLRQEVEILKTDPTKYEGELPLYDFQRIGASFLMGMPGALLADVPGLGKTIQTIAALEKCPHVVVLAPASLKYSWADEIRKWAPEASIRVIDGDKKERAGQWAGLSNWTIANYELLLYDYEAISNHVEKYGAPDALVADEATRIANPNAKTTKALKSLKAKKKIALTGTPISNTPIDLYSLIDWIAPGVLGSYFNFLNAYCVREPKYNSIIGFKNLEKLSRITAGYMLRRTKEEVLTDFPAKVVEDIKFELKSDERELYDNIRWEILEELKNMGDKTDNLAIMPVKMLRLKQCTDYPQLLVKESVNYEFPSIKSSKIEALKDLIRPIVASGDKAIVFTQFATVAQQIRIELAKEKISCLLISGDITAAMRHQIVEAFNKKENEKVLVMTEAGAYGLNLQAASYVVHYDLPWSVAKMMQREDRAHRIGQTKSVTVYNLLARGTIDEYVAKVLSKKNRVSVDILKDADRLESAGIDLEDIKAILRL